MLNNKNILLVISKFPPEYSGPGVRLPRLYKYFEDKNYNWNFNIICNGIENTKNEIYFYEGWSVRRITAEYFNHIFLRFLPKRILHSITYQYEFIKTLFVLFFSKKYKNVDILHIAGHSGGTVAALLWANIRKIPTLMEIVNAQATSWQKYFYFFKVSIPSKGKISFLTKHSAEYTKNIIEEKKWIKPNPIDSQKFNLNFDKQEIRKKLNLFDQESIIVTTVAKIIPRKNQIFLLEILKNLPEKFKFIIAGPIIGKGPNCERDKKYLQDIRYKAKKYGVDNRLLIIDDYVDSSDYIKASDVYVMPAWGEGLGTPMLEALSCGVPVVANKNEPAFCEWVVDGFNGFLSDINDSKDWEEKIIFLSKFKKDKKIAISNDVLEKVNQDKIFQEYENVFIDLVHGREAKLEHKEK